MIIFLLHPEHDTIATVIHYVYSKKAFIHSSKLSEIKLSQTSSCFDQAGEVDYFGEMYLHISVLKVTTINFYAR